MHNLMNVRNEVHFSDFIYLKWTYLLKNSDYVSYLDQYTQTFSAITKSIKGLTGHPGGIIVVMIYRGGFVLARMEVCG